MNAFLEQLAAIVAPALATLVGALVSLLLMKLSQYFVTRTKALEASAAAVLLMDTARSVVQRIEQRVVERLKDKVPDRRLTPEESKELLEEGLGLMREELSGAGGDLVQRVYGDATDRVMETRLESAVLELRREKRWAQEAPTLP